MSQLAFHPLAELFPMMEGRGFNALLADIKKNGQQKPIITLDGKILDGRARYEACQQLGIEPKVAPWSGECVTPLEFMLDRNMKRQRQELTESQLSLIADKLSTADGGRLKAYAHPMKRFHAAKLLGVSDTTVGRAVYLRTHGVPELIKAVEEGRISVNAAANASVLPPEQQRDIAAKANPYMQGVAIRLPPGLTAEETAAKGLRLENTQNLVPEKVAPLLGISHKTYRQLRDLKMAKDYEGLSAEDRKIVEKAWAILNEHGKIGAPHDMITPIITRIVGKSTRTNGARRRTAKAVGNRVESFHVRIESLLSACSAARDIDIPYLSATQAQEIAERVQDARIGLTKLQARLREASS